MLRFIGKILKWVSIGAVLLVVLLMLPVGYVEVFCKREANANNYRPIITDQNHQRVEANSYLTYPEWHIVFAYEGLAKVLETRDEHAFGYSKSVFEFWNSVCALNQVANEHGGGDFNTRATIHTIGVSYTLEMAAKALYEETIGRLFALIRGDEKTPQDIYAAKMAKDYAGFLHQVPWYKYDFDKSTGELWNLPTTDTLRGWERRLALGGEWKAKTAYAKVIAGMVEATGVAKLTIRSVVAGILPSELANIEGVEIIDASPNYVIIETPRYRAFTHILEKIILLGGQIVEIAGNDDIMLSVIAPVEAAQTALKNGKVITRLARDGYNDERLLVETKVKSLSPLFQELQQQNLQLEHVYDY